MFVVVRSIANYYNTIQPSATTTGNEHGILFQMANLHFKTFNPSKEQWDSWSRRFEQWLLLSSFSVGENAEAKKRAAFSTYVGSETFSLLCSLCAPGKPEESTYEALKGKLDKQYGVKKLVLAERYIASIPTNS